MDTLAKGKILVVVSNAHHYGDSDIDCTNHFMEIILPHHQFTQAGYEVDFVSPQGGAIPIGYISSSDTLTKQYLYDEAFMDELEHTMLPTDVEAEDYSAIFYGGGGSAMYTVPEDEMIQKLAADIYERPDGVVSAICHGTAGLAHVRLSDQRYLVDGLRVNGFPDQFERMDAAYYQEFPFSIEQIMRERGADFTYSEEGWDGYWVEDGKLLTGQDPTAATHLAKAVINKIEQLKLKS